jgi:hypothetical protein
MTPEKSAASASLKATATISPTESEIATVARQLSLGNGCPVGSHRKDWFFAKALFKNTLVAKCEDLLRRPAIPGWDTRSESEMLAGFREIGRWGKMNG